MADFIKEVLAAKRKEVEKKRRTLSFPQLFEMIKDQPYNTELSHSLLSGTGIIAEIKRASPSKGILFTGNRIEELGRIYQENGASAVSLVTEERYFMGSRNDLKKLRGIINIPILRKDFIFDEYQILESKLLGADAVLLISSLVSTKQLIKFLHLIKDIGMEALVEVHTKEQLNKALNAGAEIVGINNRNLSTLKVDVNTSKNLLPLIPDSKIRIVESGIKDERDLISYQKFKVDGFLIGETLVTAINPEVKLKRFCSALRRNDKD